MVNHKLVSYIKENLNAGYDISTIRQHLLSYYPQKDVDEAVNHVYKAQTIRHEIHLSKTTLVAVMAVLFTAVLLSSFFFFYKGEKDNVKLMDLEVDVITKDIYPGTMLEFNVQLSNMGSSEKYDITLRHEILDNNNRIINSKQETAAIGTKLSKQSRLQIPETANPGAYILKTTASYDKEKKEASASFIVKPKQEEKTGECKEECKNTDKCIETECSAATNYECEYILLQNCCGNGICEDNEESCAEDCKPLNPPEEPTSEENKTEQPEIPPEQKQSYLDIVKEAQELVNIDKDRAVSKCSEILNENYKDECIAQLAEMSNDNYFCDKITDEQKRNTCYMTWAMKNNEYNVCDKITNPDLKSACDLLKEQ